MQYLQVLRVKQDRSPCQQDDRTNTYTSSRNPPRVSPSDGYHLLHALLVSLPYFNLNKQTVHILSLAATPEQVADKKQFLD